MVEKDIIKDYSYNMLDSHPDVKSVHTFVWPFYYECKFGKELHENIDTDFKEYTLNNSEYEGYALKQYLSRDALNLFDTNGYCRMFTKSVSDGKYVIKKGNWEAKLLLDHIDLHIYEDYNFGLLFLNCINKEYSDPDIKKINDYGRRIEIPYLPRKGGYSIVSDSITIKASNEVLAKFDFKKDIDSSQSEACKGINTLNNSDKDLKKLFLAESAGNIKITPTTEDRMFAMTLICDYHLSQMVKKAGEEDDSAIEYLYPYVFIDPYDATCQNTIMRKALMDKAVDYRWSNYGTFHASTTNSLICITGELSDIKDSVAIPFLNCYKYFVSLTLCQRYVLMSLSKDYSDIIQSRNKNNFSLMAKFSRFKKLIYISEISTQEQGIEIYRIMRSQMFIDEEFEEIESQIETMNTILEANREEFLNDIAFMGTVIAVLSFLIDKLVYYCSVIPDYVSDIGIFAIGLFAVFYIFYKKYRRNKL